MTIPIPTNIDAGGQAQTFDGLAGRAILLGDTKLAREYHDKAGRIYERQVPNLRKRSDKDALRYLAAVQYYQGGHYEKALELCRKIQADMLPNRFRRDYPEFLKAVNEPAKPDYAQKMREQVQRYLQQQEYQQALDLLKEHQFVIADEDNLASVRGYCCERLGKYDVAAIFFADALQKSPDRPGLVLLSTAGPVGLVATKDVDAVWFYAEHLLNKLPHSLTYLAAAIVRFRQAVQTQEPTQKRLLYEEQYRLFLQAENRFSLLPEPVQKDSNCRELLMRGFAESVIAYHNNGQVRDAEAILDRAKDFAPDSPILKWLRENLKDLNLQTEDKWGIALQRRDRDAQKERESLVITQLAA